MLQDVAAALEDLDGKGVHRRIGNVLAALPKLAHPGAKAALAEIYNAADRKHAEVAAKAFAIDYACRATARVRQRLLERPAA